MFKNIQLRISGADISTLLVKQLIIYLQVGRLSVQLQQETGMLNPTYITYYCKV